MKDRLIYEQDAQCETENMRHFAVIHRVFPVKGASLAFAQAPQRPAIGYPAHQSGTGGNSGNILPHIS